MVLAARSAWSHWSCSEPALNGTKPPLEFKTIICQAPRSKL